MDNCSLENVSFESFLPDDTQGQITFEELVYMKEQIDRKLKSLEQKIKMYSFASSKNFAHAQKFLKAGFHFS